MSHLDSIRLRAQRWHDHHNGGPVTQAFIDRDFLLREVDRLSKALDDLSLKNDPARATNEALARYPDRG